ncbi:hypothetical protein DPMN_062749 [Dreissena polymorpha]|uniref:Uncharacterized protein n=1 Tax=Dreissena polymorpha TaxID=45954 RepID=A0A9D4CA87_DREPO|nr:hypothetical protein DPMN_062749 [Dreissena polymorpha]
MVWAIPCLPDLVSEALVISSTLPAQAPRGRCPFLLISPFLDLIAAFTSLRMMGLSSLLVAGGTFWTFGSSVVLKL